MVSESRCSLRWFVLSVYFYKRLDPFRIEKILSTESMLAFTLAHSLCYRAACSLPCMMLAASLSSDCCFDQSYKICLKEKLVIS